MLLEIIEVYEDMYIYIYTHKYWIGDCIDKFLLCSSNPCGSPSLSWTGLEKLLH